MRRLQASRSRRDPRRQQARTQAQPILVLLLFATFAPDWLLPHARQSLCDRQYDIDNYERAPKQGDSPNRVGRPDNSIARGRHRLDSASGWRRQHNNSRR